MKKIILTLFLATPAVAFAHPGHGSGFAAGILHPLTGWDHLQAMLAVGLWASSFAGRARWLVPCTFVGVMVAGFVLGAGGVALPMTEQGIAASVLVLGLLSASSGKVPVWAAMVLTGMFALFHGVAHGMELGGHGAAAFAAGFVLSTALLHMAGFFAGMLMKRHTWSVRLSGSLIGLAGLGMLLG